MSVEQDRNVEMVVEAVVKYRWVVQSCANAIVRDFHLAEDIFQEVALIVAKRWQHIPPEAELLPWLKETTRRKSYELLRKHRKMPPTLSEEILDTLSAEEFAARRFQQEETEKREEQYRHLERCLEKLPPTGQTVFRMRYGEAGPKSCEEIAETIGRSVKAVYDILARSRVALLKCVEDAGRNADRVGGS